MLFQDPRKLRPLNSRGVKMRLQYYIQQERFIARKTRRRELGEGRYGQLCYAVGNRPPGVSSMIGFTCKDNLGSQGLCYFGFSGIP